MLAATRPPLTRWQSAITVTPTSSPALSAPLSVRVLSYRIQAKAADQLEQVTPSHSRHGACTTNPDVKQVHRLVTTLLDPDQYRALDLIQLYHERWEVEVVIDELKDHQRIAQEPLVSKSQIMVLQEFYALLLAHYVLRVLMVRAAEQAGVDSDRISFTQAIVLVSDAMLLPMVQGCLLPKLVTDLARRDWLLPARRLRFNARVIKRAGWRFQLKRPTHVFLSARDFLSLRGLSRPSFLDLVLLI